MEDFTRKCSCIKMQPPWDKKKEFHNKRLKFFFDASGGLQIKDDKK
jgi:hypothetical protein